MKKKVKIKDIINLISWILAILGTMLCLIGVASQFLYQLFEYGKVVRFMIFNHWSLWIAIIGGCLAFISMVVIEITK